jgi:hypothetical protein
MESAINPVRPARDSPRPQAPSSRGIRVDGKPDCAMPPILCLCDRLVAGPAPDARVSDGSKVRRVPAAKTRRIRSHSGRMVLLGHRRGIDSPDSATAGRRSDRDRLPGRWGQGKKPKMQQLCGVRPGESADRPGLAASCAVTSSVIEHATTCFKCFWWKRNHAKSDAIHSRFDVLGRATISRATI